MAAITIYSTQIFNYELQIRQLIRIEQKFSRWDDFLSRKLHRFAEKTFRTVREHRLDPVEKHTEIAERIILKARKILVSPLDNSPLELPVLEREWVWKSTTHVDCRNLFDGISPLDNEPMEEIPPIHFFAQEMLEWTGVMKHEEEGGGGQVALLNPTPEKAKVRKFIYERLANGARAQREQQLLREQMALALEGNRRQLAEGQLVTRQALEDAELRAAHHEAHLAEELESIRQTHQESLSQLNQQMSFLEENHRREAAAIEQQIAAQDQANSEVAKMLRDQLTAMHQAHQKETSVLGNQIDSLHRTHQELETKIHHQTQARIQLEGQVSAISSQATGLKAELQQSKQQNVELTEETEKLQEASARAQQEIANLQRSVKKAKGRMCSVM